MASPLQRLIVRWLERIVLGAVAVLALTYVADLAIYSMRGHPQAQVKVNSLLAIPLKGNKTELDYQGTQPETCARALFPQGGWQPCWYLRRHTTQTNSL